MIMKLWLVRDKDEGSRLYAYTEEPIKSVYSGRFYSNSSKTFLLPSFMFPEVTWKNSPRKVKIELV